MVLELPSIALVLLALAFAAGFVVCEWIIRTYKIRGGLKGELIRKGGHVGVAVGFALAPFFIDKAELLLLAGLFTAALLLLRISKIIHAPFSVERLTGGEWLFGVGVLLSALVLLPHATLAYQFGILVAGVADSAAALVGRTFGTHQTLFPSTQKTYEGMVAFMLAALCLMVLFFGWPGAQGVVAALILASLEASVRFGLDNAFLPLAGGMAHVLLAG